MTFTFSNRTFYGVFDNGHAGDGDDNGVMVTMTLMVMVKVMMMVMVRPGDDENDDKPLP